MKIEDQVVSLELAKKLKEAGYSQEGTWGWFAEACDIGENGVDYRFFVEHADFLNNPYIKSINFDCIAPTVAELGKKLPRSVNGKLLYVEKGYCNTKKNDGWLVSYIDLRKKKLLFAEYETTKADARAKMWLYLKEKGLL